MFGPPQDILASGIAGAAMTVFDAARERAWIALLVGWLGPFAVMIAHLNVTRELSSQQKAVWRRQLWFGWTALGAVWTYLLATDLVHTTRGLLPESPDRR